MALNSISFQGSIIKGPQIGQMKREDRAQIQEYADKYDVDVHILKESQYVDGEKKYTTAVLPEYGPSFIKTFNMKFPNESHLYRRDEGAAINEVPNSFDEADIVDEEEVFI